MPSTTTGNTGRLEYWNIGRIKNKVCISLVGIIIPLFQHSIIPESSREWTFSLADVLVDLIREII